jgi:hypothetical protein
MPKGNTCLQLGSEQINFVQEQDSLSLLEQRVGDHRFPKEDGIFLDANESGDQGTKKK